MTYLKRTNRRSKQDKLKTGLILLVLVLVFLFSYLFPSFLPTIFYPISSLFWKVESGTVGFFGNALGIVRSKYGLELENARLRYEISKRDTTALMIDDLKTENEKLKNILDRSGKKSVVLGVILSRPPVSPYDTMVLDIGSDDGIDVGSRVYANGDVLVGDITEVYGNQSKVALYSMPGRKVDVLIGTSTISADAIGRGGGNFTMRLPATAKIIQGAVITTPSARSHIFGVVENISLDSSDSLMTVLFKSPVNINELKFVTVENK